MQRGLFEMHELGCLQAVVQNVTECYRVNSIFIHKSSKMFTRLNIKTRKTCHHDLNKQLLAHYSFLLTWKVGNSISSWDAMRGAQHWRIQIHHEVKVCECVYKFNDLIFPTVHSTASCTLPSELSLPLLWKI